MALTSIEANKRAKAANGKAPTKPSIGLKTPVKSKTFPGKKK